MLRPITRVTGLILLIATLAGCTSGDSGTAIPSPYPFITATPRPGSGPAPTNTAFPTPTLPAQAATPLDLPSALPTIATATGPLAATATSKPGTACRYQPQGIFATTVQADPGLLPSLGCAIGQTSGERPRLWPVTIDFQQFERGYMLWVSNIGWNKGAFVFALLDDQTYTRFDDTYDPTADPASGGETPPAGLIEPTGAIGKVWRSQPDLRGRIGFARAAAAHLDTQMQMFEYGEMIDASQAGGVIVLKQGQPGSWSLHVVNK